VIDNNEQAVVVRSQWTAHGPGGPYTRRGHLLVPAGLQIEAAPPVLPAADLGSETVGAELVPVAAVELIAVETAPGLGATPEPETGVELELVDRDDEVLDGEIDESQGWSPLGWLRRRTSTSVESAEVLYERLEADRAVVEVGRDDELSRRVAAAEHQMALDGVDEQVTAVRRGRQERARNAVEAEKLLALYRHTASAGERARIAAEIGRTAEMRALRLAKAQRLATVILLASLLGLGGWSTAGVHDGLVRLLHLGHGTAGWWAGWALEPILIAIVSGLIVLRSILRQSGGDVDGRAHKAEAVALAGSLALNLFGGWEPNAGGWTVSLGQAVAHSVGAIGAAGVAWLFGVVIGYFTAADPWTGAPRMADLVLDSSGNPSAGPSGISSGTASGRGSGTAIRRGKRAPLPVDRSALPEEMQKLLDAVRAAITDGRLKSDPSAYAIYNHVMGGRGDRNRSTDAAALVAGWRPSLHVVGDARATG
jgi:hypothetical protein